MHSKCTSFASARVTLLTGRTSGGSPSRFNERQYGSRVSWNVCGRVGSLDSTASRMSSSDIDAPGSCIPLGAEVAEPESAAEGDDDGLVAAVSLLLLSPLSGSVQPTTASSTRAQTGSNEVRSRSVCMAPP